MIPNNIIARLVSSGMGRDTLVPVPLYFRPGLVKPSQLATSLGLSKGHIQALPNSETTWPDGSVRSVKTNVFIPDYIREGEQFEVVLLGTDMPKIVKIEDTIVVRNNVLQPALWTSRPPSFKVCWDNGSNTETFEFQRVSGEPDYKIGLIWDVPFQAELPGGKWARMYLRFKYNSSQVEGYLQLGWSDSTDPNPSKTLGAVRMTCENMGIIIEDEWAKVASTNSDYDITLTEAGTWNDMQSLAFKFLLVSNLRDGNRFDPIIWQTDAADAGAFGWRIRSSPSLAATESANDWASSRMGSLVQGDPWQGGHWVPTEAGQTGDHAGFGLLGPAAALLYKAPRAIDLMRFSFYQEACRPIWEGRTGFRKWTDEDLRARGVMMWDERPHPAGNMLGKSRLPNIYTEGMRTKAGLIWWGMDRQHGDDVNWCSYLTLVDDPLAHDMAKQRAETWMAMLRTDTGNETIDGPDSGRGARLLGMLCRYYLVNPDSRIKARIRERVDLYCRLLLATGVMPSPGMVTPQQVYGPSEQAGGLPVPHWRPWEDAIVAEALAMAYAVTGESLALAAAGFIAANVVTHGYETLPGGGKRIYVALAHNAGVPLTEAQKKDVNLAKDSSGTGYHLWSAGAAATAYNCAVVLGNQQPEAIPRIKPVALEALRIFQGLLVSEPNVFEHPFEKFEVSGENSEWLAIEVLPPPAWLVTP